MKQFFGFVMCMLFLCQCGGPMLKHPSSTLQETGRPSSTHLSAMEAMDASVGIENAHYQKTLHRMLWAPGYTIAAREGALARLWSHDPVGTIRTIRQRLPRMRNWSWQTILCQWIADENVVALNEALISTWAVPTGMVQTEQERPEYKALNQMHGEDAVVDIIFESLVASNISWKQGFRTRCWELLHRLAERNKLVTLLNSSEIPEDDSFLLDLRKALNDLGIVPHRGEEILWIRELSKPHNNSFWEEARHTLASLSESRRDTLEMRDIPMAVSIRRHTPEYLNMSKSQSLQEIQKRLADRTHYYETEGGGSYSSISELFRTHRDVLTWGDAMAITTVLTAMEVPEVRAHLFDYARRDHDDNSTEYGGVIALDKKGRFEILEFEPKIRHHDRRFNASQALFDAAYTALFHFHFHAQKYRNGDHAGPGMGDKNYADNTRANCLVFTYINEHTMNVDFYRHGGIVVDLGTVSVP